VHATSLLNLRNGSVYSFHELFQADNEAHMLTITYFPFLIVCFDIENKAATIDLNQFCGSAHLLPHWCRRQVPHIHLSTNRNISFFQAIGDRSPGSILHQCNHHRSAKYLDTTCSHGRSSILVNHYGSSFSGQT
jgi:hypothetical protein